MHFPMPRIVLIKNEQFKNQYYSLMKYLLISLVLLSACKQKEPVLNKYYIVIERDELNMFGDGYEPDTKIDSVYCQNDSIA